MTRRTKQVLGSLIVLALCLAGAGTLVFRNRGTDAVAIAEHNVAGTGAPTTAAASQFAAATAGATPLPTSSVADAKKALALKLTKAKAAVAAKAKAKPKAQSVSIPAKRKSSVKKGASVWSSAGITKSLADSGVSWMYNWAASPNGVTAPKGVEYVPMIWGAKSADAATLATAKKNGDTLLGFNEPDFASQSNMTVDQALDLWPKLQATGMRLGSPAVAWGADQDGKWLDKFMAGAKTRGYRVDFITLHWYGADFNPSNATSQLRSYIQNTYAKYHKPIWVTEYALMNFGAGAKLPSASVQASFVTKSTKMMQSLSYVERYAWFAFPTSTDGTDGTGLYRPGGTPTLPGKAYRAAG